MARHESGDGIETIGRDFRPRLSRSRGERPRLYIDRLNQAVAQQRAASGATRKAKPSGRFNARGRGAKVAAGLKAHGGWESDGGMRFRSRRVVVKARVVKLAGAGGKAAAAHLRYLQREGAGLDRDAGERSPERAEGSREALAPELGGGPEIAAKRKESPALAARRTGFPPRRRRGRRRGISPMTTGGMS